MADVVIALPRRPHGMQLLELYGHLLEPSGDFNEHSQLIAPGCLSKLREAIDASLRPAPLEEIRKAVAVIVASFKIPSNLEDPPTFTRLMINDLAMYPADILGEAISHARRTFKWLPSIAEMVEICDQLLGKRRSLLCTADRMMEEHHRRRQKAEREDHGRRLREEQAARIRALYGDAVAVSPDEIKLATYFRPIMHWPIGKMFAWHESLNRGELWAARLCRRLALAERAKRAEVKGLIPPGRAAAIVTLVLVDESATRSKFADEIGEDPFVECCLESLRNPITSFEGPKFSAAVMEIEAAAWAERGIFEGDLTLPGPLVQNERFGPVPAATLNFKEDPEKTAAALKRAKEVLQLQR
jgi:hypothetical protein